MYKSQKIALDANNKQRNWFAQQCGYARFAYNYALADFKSELAKDNFLSASELNKRFNVAKKEYAWTKSQDQVVANKSILVILLPQYLIGYLIDLIFRSLSIVVQNKVSQQIVKL